MGNSLCKCRETQPTYARYHSNSKDNEPDLENVIGSLLEMDPGLQDREEGVAKVNSWIEEISPEISMSPEHLEISRWKCIKYWEAQHASDIYGNDHGTGLKLTGSCVRFYFEKKHDGTVPRLVIEHCGRSVRVQNNHAKCLPMWMKNVKLLSWRPFHKKIPRHDSCGSYGDNVLDGMNDRYG